MRIRKESKSTAKGGNQNEWITKYEFDKLYPKGYMDCNFFDQPTAYCLKPKESIREPIEMNNSRLKLSTWIELQRNLQETINIGHSEDTNILVDVLKRCEGNNFDTFASTQTPNFATHGSQSQNVFISPMKTTSKQSNKKQIKLPLIKSPCKNYGDIRTLFSTTTISTKNYTKLINDLGINNISNIPTRIINLLVDLCLEKTNVTKDCYICLNVCNCKYIQNMRETENLPLSIPIDKEPYLPSIDLLDGLNIDSLLNYTTKTNNNDDKNDLNSDADKVKIDAVSYSVNDTINNCNLDIYYHSSCETDSQGSTEGTQENELNNENNNFDIGDLDDIFAESSPEMVSQNDNDENKFRETYKYFLLNSIEDIFLDSDDEVPKSGAENKLHTLNNIIPLKRKVLLPPDEDFQKRTNEDTSICQPSPSILSYFNKKQKLNEDNDREILAKLSSYKFNNDSFGNKNTHVNFMLLSPRSSPILMAHHENVDLLLMNSEKCNTEKLQSKLDKLQIQPYK